MPDPSERPQTWKVVVAAILDTLFIFFAGGYVIGALFGGLTEEGFSLEGGPALLLFALIAAYFIGMNRYLGGTLFRRLFGIARRRA